MKKVYFKPLLPSDSIEDRSAHARSLLKHLIKKENISLEKEIPLKVHFGEKGNDTFLRSGNFCGIIDFLSQHAIESSYIETNVLYAGKRSNKTDHLKTAVEHGFTELPIVIADGDQGEEYEEIEIGQQKHFSKCKIASAFSDYHQMIILSHFKGHRMAGFGGAVKNLAMGFASRAGKMAQHANSQPFIIPLMCTKCGACLRHCPVGAIKSGLLFRIDKKKCTGCAGCISVCKKNAIIPNFLASFSKSFIERMTEYAYAANMNKSHIFISFAVNITKYCDCEGRRMSPVTEDLGIFASTDPVAIDQACLDVLDARERKKVFKRGRQAIEYGVQIGLGTSEYELITL